MNNVPCPGRIIIDLGDGFSTGCAMGAIWYFVKGSYYAVRRERIKGGLQLMRSRAPILGGSFAMWACIFSVSTCGMIYIRQREDPINSVIAGFVTGFVLAIRGGMKNAVRSAIIGGLFLGIIEGIMVIHQQYQKRQQVREQNEMINKAKKNYEKEGYRFRSPVNLKPYDRIFERPAIDKAIKERDEKVMLDSAVKLI